MTVEVATFLPLQNEIARSSWSLDEAVGVFVPTWGYTTMQRVRYGTAMWRCTLSFEKLRQESRHQLARFVAHVGQHRPFWVTDPSMNYRGVFPSSELLVNPQQAATWTAGTNRALYDDVEGIHIAMSGATASAVTGLTSPLAVTANAVYAFRAVTEPGPGSTMQVGLYAGSTRTGNNYGNSALSTVFGRRTLRCAPTGASMYVAVADNLAAPANWGFYPWLKARKLSVVRAFNVDGGSGGQTQTGSAVYVDGLTTTTYDSITPGDMLEIVSGGFSQMVRATERVNSDGSGRGYLKFEPQLRGAVSDNDLVIPVAPACRMILASVPTIDTGPGWYSDVELECVEVFE